MVHRADDVGILSASQTKTSRSGIIWYNYHQYSSIISYDSVWFRWCLPVNCYTSRSGTSPFSWSSPKNPRFRHGFFLSRAIHVGVIPPLAAGRLAQQPMRGRQMFRGHLCDGHQGVRTHQAVSGQRPEVQRSGWPGNGSLQKMAHRISIFIVDLCWFMLIYLIPSITKPTPKIINTRVHL